jgi:hypothetical protein
MKLIWNFSEHLSTNLDFGYNRTKVNEIVVEELNAFLYLDITCFDTDMPHLTFWEMRR